MTIQEANEITGGLSKTTKMPCFSYNLPAKDCNVGEMLRPIENSVCSKCYAHKGFYVFKVVKNALEKRINSISHVKWVDAMTLLIHSFESSGHFRFHDSGDIQSVKHLRDICQIATNLPNIKFWIPTREYVKTKKSPAILQAYLKKYGSFPDNLIIRLSGFLFDGRVPLPILNKLKLTDSIVSTNENLVTCPAEKNGNKCLTCRNCWDKNIQTVTYGKH